MRFDASPLPITEYVNLAAVMFGAFDAAYVCLPVHLNRAMANDHDVITVLYRLIAHFTESSPVVTKQAVNRGY